MAKEKQEAQVSSSISRIYERLLQKREVEKEAKRAAKEARKAEEEEKEREAKEKAEKEGKEYDPKEEKYQAWKSILSEITGEDLEYVTKKKKKHEYSYKKWFDIDTEDVTKPKKKKKKNYAKEFESELKMLRATVAEQNKFTDDLQRRFQNALGPASKDAPVPNKSMVDLAAAINSGRSNSLGMIREIAAIKKSIADLSMKQAKLNSELSNGGNTTNEDSTDLTLMGSNVLSALMDGTVTPEDINNASNRVNQNESNNNYETTSISNPVQNMVNNNYVIQSNFDPNTWSGGPELVNDYSKYENVPHEVVVEMNDVTGHRRFVALESNTGNELVGCNIPTSNPNELKYNENKDTITGILGETYKVKHVA